MAEMGGKLMELVGQDRLLAIQQEEGNALDGGVVEVAIALGEGDMGQKAVPVPLITLHIHG